MPSKPRPTTVGYNLRLWGPFYFWGAFALSEEGFLGGDHHHFGEWHPEMACFR